MFSNLSGHKEARKLANRLADIICPNCSERDRVSLPPLRTARNSQANGMFPHKWD